MGRTPCCEKRGLKKGPWTPEEDQKLLDYIQKHGHGNWRTLPKNAGLERCGKSCRLRWTNYLRPDIKRGRFSFEEEEIIIQLHSVLGNKWSAIAARLPGRTDNEIKNYWNTHIRKKLLRMGIDPVTHAPRYDLFDLSSILSSSLYNSSHHQLNVSRSLGLQMPVVNPDVLQLVTTLLSSQRENNINQDQLFLQNLQESQLGQAQLIQNQQFPSLIDQIQSNCPTSSTPADTILGESTQLMQPNIQQYESSFTGLVDGNADLQNYGYLGLQDESAVSCFVPENSSNLIQSHINSHENLQQCNLASVLSTPSSSTSTHPLNSYSSTHVNNSGITEDENSKDSYCSDGFKFEVPATLIMDATGFM